MTGPSALAFPGSRALAGWWQQLAPHRPRALWVAHLVLHRVEAPVRVHRPYRPDAFALHLLRTLGFLERAAAGPAGATLALLDQHLRLGPQVVHRLFDDLRREGLAAGAGGEYRLTASGRQALDEGEIQATRQERHSFYFLGGSPAAFLPLRRPETTPWVAGPDWGFDVEHLLRCLGQTPEWKRRHGFPEDVLDLVRGEPAEPGEAAAWRRVVLDYPERLPAALVLVPGEGDADRLLGFTARTDSWSLQTGAPALALDDWQEVLPQLAEEPAPPQWAQAWRAWCQPRSLPEAQTEACTLERQGNLLRVHAPPRLLDRLHGSRSDAVKGEAWILAGDGPVRKAALLEVVAAVQEKTAGPL
jgi:hypothetical protein